MKPQDRMERKRQIYEDYKKGMTSSEMIAKWGLTRQRLNQIILDVKSRDEENRPDWVDTRVWSKLQKQGISLEQAYEMSDDELLNIKQFGPKRVALIRQYQKNALLA